MGSSKIRYWLNLLALLTGLIACIGFILLLKADHAPQFFASLGFGKSGDTLNWCSNRVESMTFPSHGGAKIVEKGGKWLWEDSSSVVLDYLDVEKWFAKHCQIPISKLDFKDYDSRLLPLIEVQFVDGDAVTFYDLGFERIQLDTHIFKSPSFQKAYKELLNFGPSQH